MQNRVLRLVLAASAGLVCALTAQPSFSQTSFPKQFVTPQYLGGVGYQVTGGTSGYLIGVGDLNGDGRPDILYQNTELLATGSGTFRSIAVPQQFPFGSQLADVTGDGKLDVVAPVPADETCDYNPDGTPYCIINSDAFLKVFPGNGDGTFRSGSSLDLGQEGTGNPSLDLFDLNGDGKLDALLAFVGNPEDDLSASSFVLLNNGSGTFHQVGTSGFHNVLAGGDFNGDGKMDLAVGGNEVTIYLGKGDGTFANGITAGSFSALAGAVGDFNHDGHLDLAVVNVKTSNDESVYLMQGKGDGTFSSRRIAQIATYYAGQVAAVDLNHDGYLDLIIGSNSSFDVFTNLRNGTLSNPREFSEETIDGLPMGFGDFNHDGYLDIVTGNIVSYGTYGAEFRTPIVSQSYGADSIAVGDFDRDGIEDVAVANSQGFATVFTGSGAGYLNPGVNYSTGIQDGQIAVGDINGDGIADLVVTRGNTGTPSGQNHDVSVLLGNGNGTFRAAINSSVLGQPAAHTLNNQTYAIDVNRDGKADLVGDWGIALSHGDGTFAKPIPFPAAALPLAALGVGDLNRDGNVDFVLGSSSEATIYTLLGDGQGGFTLHHQEKLNYTQPQLYALNIADMDGDNIPDLVYLYTATPSSGVYGRVMVELGDGSGNFGNAAGVRIDYNGFAYNSLLIDDFNRDGKQDVVVLTLSVERGLPGFGESVLLRGTGGGGLSAPQYFPLQLQSALGASIDLNGDGAPDIAGPSLEEDGIERVLNTGSKQ